MQLDLTDGTTTVILSSGSAPTRGCTYFPLPAQSVAKVHHVTTLLDDVSVTEAAEVILSGTDVQIRALTQQIENLFYQARLRQEIGAGPRIWVEYRPVPGDVLYRSLLFDGSLAWSETPELRRLRDNNLTAVVTLTFSRQPYWEGPLTELPLAANGQAAATGGRTIHNKSDNWVEIAGTDVAGVLPAGVKLSLKNATGANQGYVNFFLATGAYNDAPNFTHILEGESFVGTTSTASASASNGFYGAVSFGGAGTYLLSYAMSSAQMTKCGGRIFRLLARLMTTPTMTLYVTPQLRDSSGLIPLAAGPEVAITTSSSTLLDLGDLPLPPAPNLQIFDALTVCLLVRVTAANSLNLDFVQLTPTDALRHLRQRGNMLIPNEAAVDDNIEEEAYSDDGSNKFPIFERLAGPILVWPGRTQRIYTLNDKSSGATSISDALTVQAWYRPRRLTA